MMVVYGHALIKWLNAMREQILWGLSHGGDLAVVAAEEAVNVLGVQGAVAALQRSHGGRPEVVRAARGTVNAGQGVAHPQRHVQHLLQLALQQFTLLTVEVHGFCKLPHAKRMTSECCQCLIKASHSGMLSTHAARAVQWQPSTQCRLIGIQD